MMQDGDGVPLRPREGIISTARDLFRKHGIRGIGVDAIAEAAGTNKMTLYRHFGSKDDLIVACLRDVASEVDEIWKRFEREYTDDPIGELGAWVRVGAECVLEDGRGCDMANVAIELAECDHPARHVIEEFKKDQRNRLANLCRRRESRKRNCWQTPCRFCLRAPASVARVWELKDRVHILSRLVKP